MISAVTANVVAQAFEGSVRAFVIPEYVLVSPWEFLFYVLLGLIAAALGATFTRLLYASEDLFDKLPFPPEYFKPILGGLILGLIGLISFKMNGFPRVFGVGYDSIGEALFGKCSQVNQSISTPQSWQRNEVLASFIFIPAFAVDNYKTRELHH